MERRGPSRRDSNLVYWPGSNLLLQLLHFRHPWRSHFSCNCCTSASMRSLEPALRRVQRQVLAAAAAGATAARERSACAAGRTLVVTDCACATPSISLDDYVKLAPTRAGTTLRTQVRVPARSTGPDCLRSRAPSNRRRAPRARGDRRCRVQACRDGHRQRHAERRWGGEPHIDRDRSPMVCLRVRRGHGAFSGAAATAPAPTAATRTSTMARAVIASP